MKISPSKIKRWSIKQRLREIKKRVELSWDDTGISPDTNEYLEETHEILDYWMEHLDDVVKPSKPKKPSKKKGKKTTNLWEDWL